MGSQLAEDVPHRIMIGIQIFSDDIVRDQIVDCLHIDARQVGSFDRNGDAAALEFIDVFGILQHAFPFNQHQIPFGKERFGDRAPTGFGDDDVAGGKVVVGVEGFDGQLDDSCIGIGRDIDAAGGEDGTVVVVDLDVVQVGRLAAGDEDTGAVLGFDGGDAVGIETAADEADLFSWNGQFGCRQHQVVLDQEVEFGVDFPEAGNDGVGKAKELVLLAPGEIGDADVAHPQLFPHLDADGADVTDDAGDRQIAQNGDFRGDGRIPAGHEIGQFVLEMRDINLQAIVLVDQTDFGADVPVDHAVTEAREVNAGEVVLIDATRKVNHMIGRLQKFLDDRQATGHMPEAVG